MNRVRIKDLALVAVAGGLLAFELVSIGEALPNVKKALADRGLSGKVKVASASAAAVTLPAVETASSTVTWEVAGAAESHAHRLAASTSAAPSKRCVVTRTRQGTHGRLRVVTVTSDASCSVGPVTQSVVRRREVEKAVDLALKQATL